MLNNNKKILVSGSIVYDRIMTFPGFFKDHILPDKIHILNISFTLGKVEESFGGTGANIVYNLSLLKQRAILLGLVGKDFEPYRLWLEKNKIDTSYIRKNKNELTASAYVMTDQADNQITGFYPGPLDVDYCQSVFKIKNIGLAIISPDFKLRMLEYARIYNQLKVPYIFDPGQAIPSFTAAELKKIIAKAKVLIGNDYEIELILNMLKINQASLLNLVDTLVITKGVIGSEIFSSGKKIKIKAAKVISTIDPTGAGDAYRAGMIKGLIGAFDWKKTGQLAGTIAAYAVEKQGTQAHRFNLREFNQRYKNNFKEEI